MNIVLQYLEKKVSIEIYEKDIVSNDIKGSGNFYEFDFLKYVYLNHNKQQTIIDIGANIGNHSLFFSEFLDYEKIICFEPFIGNFEILKRNMFSKKAEMYDVALSERNGHSTLYNSEKGNNGGFSLCDYGEGISYVVCESVETRTLDSYNFNNISMLKIDVEGHELSVLNGSLKTIKENNPIIFVENLAHGYPGQFKIDQFDDFIKKIEYTKVKENIGDSYLDLWVSIK